MQALEAGGYQRVQYPFAYVRAIGVPGVVDPAAFSFAHDITRAALVGRALRLYVSIEEYGHEFCTVTGNLNIVAQLTTAGAQRILEFHDALERQVDRRFNPCMFDAMHVLRLCDIVAFDIVRGDLRRPLRDALLRHGTFGTSFHGIDEENGRLGVVSARARRHIRQLESQQATIRFMEMYEAAGRTPVQGARTPAYMLPREMFVEVVRMVGTARPTDELLVPVDDSPETVRASAGYVRRVCSQTLVMDFTQRQARAYTLNAAFLPEERAQVAAFARAAGALLLVMYVFRFNAELSGFERFDEIRMNRDDEEYGRGSVAQRLVR